jgi:hypothetical protein
MKTSLKVLLAFAAGVTCASVIAGGEWNRSMPPEEWLRLGNQQVLDISELGVDVVKVDRGLVWLNLSTHDSCMVPPPKPKMTDPRAFEMGIAALRELYKAQLVGNENPIRLTDRCQTE